MIVLTGGMWVRCHAEEAGVSCSGISAGHQDNFVQSSELTHRVTASYVTAENQGIRGNAQAPGQPPQCAVVVVYSCALVSST